VNADLYTCIVADTVIVIISAADEVCRLWSRNEEDDGAVMKQVKAQVMSRDDSSGGWVPVAGGGMSIVALTRVSSESDDVGDLRYKIAGHRQVDGFVSVSHSVQHLQGVHKKQSQLLFSTASSNRN